MGDYAGGFSLLWELCIPQNCSMISPLTCEGLQLSYFSGLLFIYSIGVPLYV